VSKVKVSESSPILWRVIAEMLGTFEWIGRPLNAHNFLGSSDRSGVLTNGIVDRAREKLQTLG
jgi:hypothetical protein